MKTPAPKARLMTILEIKHYRENEVIWEAKNIPNIFHESGERFLFSVAFDTDGGYSIPTFYYIGLDNRTTVLYDDDIGSITGEPSSNGYGRQTVSSSSGFGITLTDGRIRATSGILTFTAIGGSWGPVKNVFLTTSTDSSGDLIASSALSSERTLNNGDHLTVRFKLAFDSC